MTSPLREEGSGRLSTHLHHARGKDLGSCGYVEYEQANVERATDGNLPSESWDLIFEVVDLVEFVDTSEVMTALIHQLQSDNTKVRIYALTVDPLLLLI